MIKEKIYNSFDLAYKYSNLEIKKIFLLKLNQNLS